LSEWQLKRGDDPFFKEYNHFDLSFSIFKEMERENLPLLDLDIIEEVKINPVLVNLVLYAKSITDYMHHLVVVWRVQYYVLVQR